MKERLEKLKHELQEARLDALIVSTPENRRYLSGFVGTAGYLVITADAAVLATDFRYVEQAGHQAPHFRVLRIGADWAWLPKLLTELGAQRTGLEAQNVTVATYKQMADALKEAHSEGPLTLVPTQGIVEGLRAVKDPQELALLERAARIASDAFDSVAPAIGPGQTEREIAWRLELHMREHGAEAMAFDIIVASGPNGALPHHRASDRALQPGDPVVIDMGARFDGYNSDMTRTICLPPVSDTFKRVYDTVLAAQLTAVHTIQAGMTGHQADYTARYLIQKAGHGDNFGHSLGHGIGLAVHEAPRLGIDSQARLEDGVVFTIEPGIYITGWGGVRIEDMAVLDKGRPRLLTTARKQETSRA
ncbi:MAG: aminopeptidase P family protein [Chloroflexi bacterium]|nr:aminopeptidase P family protein [Chloroflexota bacterium]